MSEHYPRIRLHMDNGLMLLRDGLSLCFFMQRPHREVATSVLLALDTYLRAVGEQVFSAYDEMAGYWRQLDKAGWSQIRRDLIDNQRGILLHDKAADLKRYYFEYRGKPLDDPSFVEGWPNEVTTVSFWLSTEYLEEHGPAWVRQLALEIAETLSFNSGHAGLSFNGELDIVGVNRSLCEYCFRYPGFDINANFLEWDAGHLGTRVRGPAWMTFLGQPVLGELGGVEGLRARLQSPGTIVEVMSGDRAVVTLGEWPEASDTEQGLTLPAYRELARVLEPWLFRRGQSAFNLSEEEVKRWENRFFD